MDLWIVFVLAQLRLCLNISYEMLHNLANNHRTLRQLMGVERKFGYEPIEFEYQHIYDNVSMLGDDMIKELNQVIIEFGHGVFKKKENTALHLKSDSFVVESNVHFPTDYNLLWDCARKCLDTITKFIDKHESQPGWRKVSNWRYELKGLMRELGRASSSGGKNKQERIISSAQKYLEKSKALNKKIKAELPSFALNDIEDLALVISIEHYMGLLEKHIDLVERRVIKKETIPHKEKMFSIFETYTEMIKKGKMHPNVELGKKLMITTDQYNLIIDHRLMEDEQDRDVTIGIADRVLSRYKVESWSFDKGFWDRDAKELLQFEVQKVIMPKLGRLNKEEEVEQNSRAFKKLKNRHSAIESNINELENRGLDRCPDKGIFNYKRYISLAICAYNLKKIGRQLLQLERGEIEAGKIRQAA
jgi:transposase, IS5 family